jgi:hypothetical protein
VSEAGDTAGADQGLPRGAEGAACRPLRAAFGVAAATAVLLALAACGAHAGDDPAVSAVERPAPGACGGPFAVDGHPGLTLAGSFPARVRARGQGTFDGGVTVANHTDRRVRGLAASRPDVYVTRAGAIVATPLPRDEVGLVLDLPPGADRDFAAAGSLRSCRGGRRLSPGRYEVHAVLRIEAVDGAHTIAAVGGPWALDIV